MFRGWIESQLLASLCDGPVGRVAKSQRLLGRRHGPADHGGRPADFSGPSDSIWGAAARISALTRRAAGLATERDAPQERRGALEAAAAPLQRCVG